MDEESNFMAIVMLAGPTHFYRNTCKLNWGYRHGTDYEFAIVLTWISITNKNPPHLRPRVLVEPANDELNCMMWE
ncbi:MAG: hypothetical protein NTV01_18585 [Bacteroidia bacterium]|nr:hypothetical protein [Bacteroidia bacterium]